MNENIFDKRRIKTFSNCKDLVKSMVGTREGMIVYNEKFRIDLENTCYKASICEDLSIENQQLKDKIKELKEENFKLQARSDRFINYWNKLKEWLEEEIYNIEPKGTAINYNCEYDSEEDYINAMKERSKLITLKRVLIKLQEIEGGMNE